MKNILEINQKLEMPTNQIDQKQNTLSVSQKLFRGFLGIILAGCATVQDAFGARIVDKNINITAMAGAYLDESGNPEYGIRVSGINNMDTAYTGTIKVNGVEIPYTAEKGVFESIFELPVKEAKLPENVVVDYQAPGCISGDTDPREAVVNKICSK